MFISFIFKRIPIDCLYVHALDKRLDTTKGNWKKIIINFDLLRFKKKQSFCIVAINFCDHSLLAEEFKVS